MISSVQPGRSRPPHLRASLLLLACLAWGWGMPPSLAFPTCDTLTAAAPPVSGQQGVALATAPGAAAAAQDCWISPAQAAQQRGAGQALWIDVRPAATRRQIPLQGVLEISLAELPDRAFLRTQSTVLVGTGWDNHALANACLQLRQAGFHKLVVLRDGVQAWRASGGLGGPPMSAPGLPPLPGWLAIDPSEVREALTARPWRVITVGLDAAALADVPGEQLVRALPWPVSASALQSAVQAALASPPAATPVTPPRQARTNPPKAHSPLGENAAVLLIPATAQIAQGLPALLADLPQGADASATPPAANRYWLSAGWADHLQRSRDALSIAQNAGRPLTRPCSAL